MCSLQINSLIARSQATQTTIFVVVKNKKVSFPRVMILRVTVNLYASWVSIGICLYALWLPDDSLLLLLLSVDNSKVMTN
jgi:hypothetical protein